ncbi:MAG: deoxyribodipyrimidine photolyase [Marinilabiliales bacterium]|nr:MAG: deoxyribodipyrimidine photolyase [Marinilabiliales bacterium]
MSRDQRVGDNWALLYAARLAADTGAPPLVAFAVSNSYPGANARHYGFMLRGLADVEKKLTAAGIPFILFLGSPPDCIAAFAKRIGAGAVVTDFDPLKIKKEWKNELIRQISIPLYDVDAHNIVPCRVASGKQEYGAYTLRPKIKKLLEEFLDEFPELPRFKTGSNHDSAGTPEIKTGRKSDDYIEKLRRGDRMPCEMLISGVGDKIPDWQEVISKFLVNTDSTVKEIETIVPGEDAAKDAFAGFTENRLSRYGEQRNDPNAKAVSDMSPYLHFGHISAQRMALEILKNFPKNPSGDAFLEELIVRKELSDNFCHYNEHYDSFEGFPDWAKKTLNSHRKDEREYLYAREQFELAATHDQLWNAAQTEMVKTGKMHGYMRMYWAKKILEWTRSPEEALSTAIYLNDKYELDGRDPNGYTGCAWSIGGVHDRAWSERPVFGKIRYMNARGAGRKFSTAGYIKNFLS